MPKYFLSICAVVKDEALYIREWIAFHQLMGVEHFYLYNNESVDCTKDLLSEYECVTVIDYPVQHPQLPAYASFLLNYGAETEWAAFIDVDEFLWSPKYVGEETPVVSAINKLSGTYFGKYDGSTDSVGAIAAHWLMFGSNGEEGYRDELVTKRFTRRGTSPNKHVKSIVRCAAALQVGKDPHSFYLRDGAAVIDDSCNKLPLDYAIVGGQSAEVIAINHYHTKSRPEYIRRKLNKPCSSAKVIRDREWVEHSFKVHDQNDVEDTRVRDAYSERIQQCLEYPPSHQTVQTPDTTGDTHSESGKPETEYTSDSTQLPLPLDLVKS